MSHRVGAEKAGTNAPFEDSAAAGAAVDGGNTPIDADLQAIVERWPDLPDAVKAGFVAMVRAATWPRE